MAVNFRYEEKYLINYRQYEIVKKRVEKLFSIDNFANENKEYIISSVYFDDYHKKSVNDNLQGLKERYKYRIRYYNHNRDVIKLEKKIKNNEQGYKRKISVSKEEYYELIKGNYNLFSKRQEELAIELVHAMKTNLLKPLILIEYHRNPFTLPFNDIRITFDKDICYSVKNFGNDDPKHRTYITDKVILEIKYNNFLPYYIRKLFSTDSITKMSISKYLLCYLHSIGEDINI